MYNDERERYIQDESQEFSARSRYTRYDYERDYEEQRNRTPDSYRDSLQSSLERPVARPRLERSDEARFDWYRASAGEERNNYDKFFDSKHNQPKTPSKKRRTLVAVMLLIVFVAILATTVAVIGVEGTSVVQPQALSVESLTASVGDALLSGNDVAAAEYAQEQPLILGGENYILLKSGELVAVEIPAQTVVAAEEEKGFDKLCSWLNGVFGG